MYTTRLFQPKDVNDVPLLIIKTLRSSNIKDYSVEYIEKDVARFTPNDVIRRAEKNIFMMHVRKKKLLDVMQ